MKPVTKDEFNAFLGVRWDYYSPGSDFFFHDGFAIHIVNKPGKHYDYCSEANIYVPGIPTEKSWKQVAHFECEDMEKLVEAVKVYVGIDPYLTGGAAWLIWLFATLVGIGCGFFIGLLFKA